MKSFIKSGLASFWEVLKTFILVMLIVLPIRYFVFQPFFVRGQSMEPNFHNGDYLIIDEISYRFSEPKRGEVIVFNYPNIPSQRYIKRIIGLPGETVEVKNGQILVTKDGKTEILEETAYLDEDLFSQGNVKITLGEDEYFVMGDNRPASYDSRRWGAVPRKNILGKVYLRAWPIAALAKIEIPAY